MMKKEILSTTEVCLKLKKIYGRRFRASELNIYAEKMSKKLKRTEAGNGYYQWVPEDIEILKTLITD